MIYFRRSTLSGNERRHKQTSLSPGKDSCFMFCQAFCDKKNGGGRRKLKDQVFFDKEACRIVMSVRDDHGRSNMNGAPFWFLLQLIYLIQLSTEHHLSTGNSRTKKALLFCSSCQKGTAKHNQNSR